MKILHLISSGGMYGAEAVILNLSTALNKGPHRSLLAAFSSTSQPNVQLRESAARHNLQFYALDCNGQFDRKLPKALRQLVQESGAEIVHAHGYKADVYAWLALRSYRIPLVSTCHTWYDTDLAVRLYGALDRFVLRSFSGVVAVSDQVKQRLLDAGVNAARIRLIRNGIDLQTFTTDRQLAPHLHSEDPLTVGLVGRLSWEKNVDLFLQSAALVLAQRPSTRFLVVGDGPDRPKLEALLDALDLRAQATLLGRSENMPAIYASFDVMVSSSRQEGLPVAILEGMASSLPLVATSVGAVPTAVRDGVNGILVPSEDLQALTAAILALLRDSNRRSRFGAAGRQIVAEEFSADRMTQDYLDLYEEVLRNPSASKPSRPPSHAAAPSRNLP